jgi:hypothetical protein
MARQPGHRRSTQDAIGIQLIEAGRRLLTSGTRLDELKIADAVELASVEGPPVGASTAYRRFRDQAEFRQAVLRAHLRSAPRHRSVALDVVARTLMEIWAANEGELKPADVPKFLFDVAEEQQRALRDDNDLALRLYALYRLSFEDEQAQELKEDLRLWDEQINKEWTETVRTLAQEFGVKPLNDLEYEEFEIALTSLLIGVTIRQRTSEVPADVFPRLVGAFVLGYFQREDRDMSVTGRVLGFFQNSQRRLKHVTSTLKELADLNQLPGQQSLSQAQSQPDLQLSEPVRRALAASDANRLSD